MVSTEKRYAHDNLSALRGATLRGEYLYHVRLYSERAQFQSEAAGVLRVRMLLGFIEARSVVIDAMIKTEGTLHYLSVVCSSWADPASFSRIMKLTASQAVIEEIDKKNAEAWICARATRAEPWGGIPFAGAVRTVNESRRILISLLLEYRALLAEYFSVLPSEHGVSRSRDGNALAVSFLLFEQNGSLCGVPDFQTAGVSGGSNGSCIIQLQRDFGQRLLVCDDLICMKELRVTDIAFTSKRARGYYSVEAPTAGGPFGFTLVVPSFL